MAGSKPYIYYVYILSLLLKLKDMVTPEIVGANIATQRKAKGLTQQELADKLGIAKVTVTLYEGGRNNFTINTLSKIADALGCNFNDLTKI